MVTLMLPMAAKADDSGSCGENVTYTFTEATHTLTISGSGEMKNYEFESSLHPGAYGTIETPWENYKEDIHNLIIESGVTSIGSYAFHDLSNLISVTIPNSVIKLGRSSFLRCSSLISFNIPDNVSKIEDNVFFGCTSLVNISIPNGVTTLGYGSFYACTSLYSINIPQSVISIGDDCFLSCSSLVTINLPNNITKIGKSTFQWCTELSSITIPNSVTSIGDGAFYMCQKLASINIPSTVTSIGYTAFSGCTALESVYITDISKWCDITFGLEANPLLYAKHFYLNNEEITDLVIPDNVESISKYAFYNCSSINSVYLPEGLTSIGDYAFSGCSKISVVSIPENVMNIGESAFEECQKLSTLSLPTNLQIIKKRTFAGCKAITNIIVPSKIQVIYQEAFSGCSKLNKIEVQSSTPPFIYDNSFSNFSIPVKVPKGCKEVYQSAHGWKNFQNIYDADKYKLTYVVDGDDYKSYNIEEGASITPEPIPIKDGYSFSGWSEIPETMPAHDVTVTGTFSRNKYKLNYIVDGEEYKTYDLDYGASITPEPAPTKEGYTFSGWSKIPQTMPAHDVTITGLFSINQYQVTYIVDGDIFKTEYVEYESEITPPSVPEREGYSFAWNEYPETMPANDITITGQYNINSYKLSYVVDGVEYKIFDVVYNTSITPEPDPTKEGYTFSGWSQIPETMPAHDLTITGSFSVNSYKLFYILDNMVYKETMYEYGATIIPEPQPEGEYVYFEWIGIPETMPAHDVIVTSNYTTEIKDVLIMIQEGAKIYTPNGKQIEILQKGLNIIRTNDGKVMKIVVK